MPEARRTLVVGDVHGCAVELGELLARSQATALILVGDLFTKGPDPLGVWRIIEAWRPLAVLGNHDDWVLRHPERAPATLLPPEALDWLRDLPLTLDLPGLTIVHGGLHPTEGPAGTTRDQALHLRRWPDDRDPAHPFWWQLYQGGPLVIYGHDAVRGLQDHRPRSLGLDSGCVYGQQLSGLVLETGELHQVQARAAYRLVGEGRGHGGGG